MKTATLILMIALLSPTKQQSVNKLTNTKWSLVKVIKEEVTQVADTTCRTTLNFNDSGHYTGYSGWNTFHGHYKINSNGGKLTMDNPIRTKRAGQPNCKLGETLFDNFPKVSNFVLHGDTLIIRTVNNVKIIYSKSTPHQ